MDRKSLRGASLAAVLLAVAGTLPASPVGPDAAPERQGALDSIFLLNRTTGELVPLRDLSEADVERVLTYLAHAQDQDKDGFIDAKMLGEVNPTGYVVFHFRSLWLNERVTLGGAGGNAITVSLGNVLGGGGAPGGPTPLDGGWGGGDGPWFDPPPDGGDGGGGPDVPEPATAALLACGLLPLLRRRRLGAGRSA